MRFSVVMAVALLTGCASDRLAMAPPAGVDLSGHWLLNVEDSDDPLHLIQSQNQDASKPTQSPQGQGGRGGRGGRGAYPAGTYPAPATPAFSALSEGLRWPGKDLDIKQTGGIVAIASSGVSQVYTPTSGNGGNHLHHRPSDDGDTGGRDRDMPARDRGPPPTCGWHDTTLVVQSAESDDDQPPFEKRYSLSEDGQRLIEVTGFKGGRSGGFTMSRVWDRAPNQATDPK